MGGGLVWFIYFFSTPIMKSSFKQSRYALRDRPSVSYRGGVVAQQSVADQDVAQCDGNRPIDGGRTFACHICGSTCPTSRGIKIHMSRVHKVKEEGGRSMARAASTEAIPSAQSEDSAQHHKNPFWTSDFSHKSKILPSEQIKSCVRKPALRLPHLNDAKAWGLLEEAIMVKVDDVMKAGGDGAPQKMIALEDHIYSVCAKLHGTREEKSASHVKAAPSKRRRPRELVLLAKQKTQLRREWRIAKAAGLDTRELHRKLMGVVRAHSQLVRLVKSSREKGLEKQERERFLKDPQRFARELFHPPAVGKPEFGKEAADAFFSKQFADSDRSFEYKPLEGLPRPPRPKTPFRVGCITDREFGHVLRKKKNGSAPGMNGIPYTVYKRCPRVATVLLNIFRAVWERREIPSSWQVGRVTLIPKSGDNSDPGLMRDITVLNVEGRLFWAVFQRRLASFLVENEYLPRAVQKAFLENVAGCVEHATTLGEALKDARRRTRQVVVAWLDLKNAYGSVRHSMIQFALKWYHIPRRVVELFVNYVEGIFLQVQANGWVSEWFGLEIGVPKGCTASTIVFDLAFQLVLDMHRFFCKNKATGYELESGVCVQAPAYADDVALAERSPEAAQASLSAFDEGLQWTVTMELKPVKCKTLAFRKFEVGGYKSFDAKLSLRGTTLPFIGDEIFFYLGRGFQADGKEDCVFGRLEKKAEADLGKVDQTRLTGPQKAWIADTFVIARLCWSLMIHNFAITVVGRLRARVHRCFRKWVGLAKAADGNVLYRSNTNYGLGLKDVSELCRRLQIVKWHIMRNSLDVVAQKMFSHRLALDKRGHVGTGRDSSPCLELAEALYAIKCEDMVGPGNVGRAGLGSIKRKKVSERERVKNFLRREEEAKRTVAALEYKAQNDWVVWGVNISSLMERDLNWKKVLFQYSEKLLRFTVNAIQGTLPSPDNLMRWNKAAEFHCGCCGKKGATSRHILVGCPWVHQVEHRLPTGSRYTFRHNQILRAIARELAAFADKVNASPVCSEPAATGPASDRQPLIEFCKRNKRRRRRPAKVDKNRGWLWGPSRDWQCAFHLSEWGLREDKAYSFPADVCVTDLCPDGYVISRSAKRIVIVELTSPWEEKLAHWHKVKSDKYDIGICKDAAAAGWDVFKLVLEVGARGFVPPSFGTDLRKVGMEWPQIKSLQSAVTDAARKASFVIFINRFNQKFLPWGPAFQSVPPPPQEDAHFV